MIKHAFLIGLCGAGMRSLVDYLLAEGWTVTGSDQSMTLQQKAELSARGITSYSHHDQRNIPEETSLLIYSLAIPQNNPEREFAVSQQIPNFSYVEYLAKLFDQSYGIGIAGTHGKTTTTSLTSYLLRHAEHDPSVISGGTIQGEQASGYRGQSDLLIAECCEFQKSLLNYHPKIAVLLGIDQDHFDCYPDEKILLETFTQFCSQLDPENLLVVNTDCERTTIACRAARCRVVRFSVQNNLDADWRVTSIQANPSGIVFSVRTPDSEELSFNIPCFGQHQIINSLAAIIVARELKIDSEQISQALRSFPGVERRFESRGEYRGAICIDDYAHHPREIEATLSAARQKYGDSQMIVAFEPHQILRTEMLMDQFAAAFDQASQIFILPVYAAREVESEKVFSVAKALVDRGNSRVGLPESKNLRFEYSPSLDHLRSSLDDALSEDEKAGTKLFLTLGAGNIDRIYHELSR